MKGKELRENSNLRFIRIVLRAIQSGTVRTYRRARIYYCSATLFVLGTILYASCADRIKQMQYSERSMFPRWCPGKSLIHSKYIRYDPFHKLCLIL